MKRKQQVDFKIVIVSKVALEYKKKKKVTSL